MEDVTGGGKLIPFKKGETHPRYHSVEYHQSCQQILNDLGELFFSEGRCYLDEIEQVVIRNINERFTQGGTADLLGISVRTVRNKLNERL